MKIPRDKYGHFAKGIKPSPHKGVRLGAFEKKEKFCDKCKNKFLGGGTAKYCNDCKGF